MADAKQVGPSRGVVFLALLIVMLGLGWLLTVLGLAPDVGWVWTFSLGLVGVLVFVVSRGLDKVSVVLGPFLIVASFLSIFRQSDRLRLDVEIPILTMVLGGLLLLSQLPAIRLPRWYTPNEQHVSRS